MPRCTASSTYLHATRAPQLEKQIEKKIKKTHREKIKEFNDHLGSLTEHHDIPRVGPG